MELDKYGSNEHILETMHFGIDAVFRGAEITADSMAFDERCFSSKQLEQYKSYMHRMIDSIAENFGLIK